jgi:hypothetical protein
MSKYEPFNLDIQWSIADIRSLRPDWSKDKCDEVLSDMAGIIEERSIETGWEVIESLIGDYDE